MIFPTVQFAAFFAVVLPLSWLLMPRPRLWKPTMLVASYVFYGYADWRFCALLAFSTLANQLAAVKVTAAGDNDRARKAWVGAAVAVDLGLLGVFKYLDFLIASVDAALRRVGLEAPLPLLQVALPVGISFFTFQAISYVVDVHRGRAQVAPLLDFAIYEAFFPHLVAGPIVRAREFLPQLRAPRDPRAVPAVPALFLIAGGLFKKVVLADYLATTLVDPVFDSPAAHSGPETLLAVYGYAAQIYCDFSAYTDMAIGLALLLGFRFPQNFDRPYAATSLQDFWRRWHMTLSRWLRDYLYIPLGGSRKGRRRTYVNLALTMLLGGLWHGGAWTFVVWGGIHGAGLALERWWRERGHGRGPGEGAAPGPDEPRRTSATARTVLPAQAGTDHRGQVAPAGSRRAVAAPVLEAERVGQSAPAGPQAQDRMRRHWLGWLVTFHVVCLAWVFFRAPDVAGAFTVLGRLAHWGPVPLATPAVLLALAAGLGTHLVPARAWRGLQVRFAAAPLPAQAVLLAAVVLVVNALVGEQGVAPFIYFRF